jgi:hypothetical protein
MVSRLFFIALYLYLVEISDGMNIRLILGNTIFASGGRIWCDKIVFKLFIEIG